MQPHGSASPDAPKMRPDHLPEIQVAEAEAHPGRKPIRREALTDKRLRGLKPARPGTRYVIHDGRSGLAVRVTDRGERSWLVRPRLGTVPITVTVGSYPEVSLEDARTLALGALRAADDRVDPRGLTREQLRAIGTATLRPKAAARSDDGRPQTFGQLAAVFLASPAVVGKPSERETRRIVTTYFLTSGTDDAPSVDWRQVPGADLDRREINAALDRLVKRGPVQANHSSC
jgi:hypothetical protein